MGGNKHVPDPVRGIIYFSGPFGSRSNIFCMDPDPPQDPDAFIYTKKTRKKTRFLQCCDLKITYCPKKYNVQVPRIINKQIKKGK
jgi:hypothetical protein